MSQKYSLQESKDRTLLSVAYDANMQEIRNSYLKLSKQIFFTEPVDLKRFTEISTAYKNLLNNRYITSDVEYNVDDKAEENAENIIDILQELERQKRERISFLISPIIFLLFLVAAVLLSICLWGIHPVLGLFSVLISIWMLINKWKTGYYLGE